MSHTTPLSLELQARGYIHQCTAETLAEIVDGEPRVIYHGIDPTADSATVGNMVVWLLLRHLADRGHTILFLVGGGTGMIGDPKPDSERTLQTPEQVAVNVAKIKAQAERLIGAGGSIEFVNNADWLMELPLIDFLRDIGKHFTVNELMKKEAIANRLAQETGISYTEFAYPLLQGFDYLTLFRERHCTLQVGGSDQWGNILAGVELVRRKEQAVVHALTTPLIIDAATGKKFGKSEGNAVWLDAEKTSPFTFYQFWLQVSDAAVIDYLKIFTLLPLEEIQRVEETWQANPAGRQAQKALAYAITTFVHGRETAQAVETASEVLFSDGGMTNLSPEVLTLLQQNSPYFTLPLGSDLVSTLVVSNLAQSKREARTFIESGAVSINGSVVTDTTATVPGQAGTHLLLKRGKKHRAVIEITAT